ncbi:hypothetical protein EON65_52960 [archaeon]|nr:MAG: hypothetical protein EON65_52960 [archaeon]
MSKWGASEIHRRSYAPVRKAIENWDRKTAKGEQEEGLDGKQKEGVDEELTGRGKRKRKSAIDVMEAPTISNKAKPDSKTKLPTSISKPESKSADKSSGRKSIGRKKHIEAAKAAPISSIRRSSRLANKQEV